MVNDRRRTPAELAGILFRLMANRGGGSFDSQYDGRHELPDWWVRLNRIYAQALPHMRQRCLLPEGQGVRWRGEQADVVWAYGAVHVATVPGTAAVRRIEPDGPVPEPAGAGFLLAAGNVYLMAH
jgi:hypothetical protein